MTESIRIDNEIAKRSLYLFQAFYLFTIRQEVKIVEITTIIVIIEYYVHKKV